MFPTDSFFPDLDHVLNTFNDADRPRLRKMVDELERIAERVPGVAEKCYAYQARLYARLQEYEQALAAVDRAIAFAPLDRDLVILRGDIYREAQEFSKAMLDYSRVLEQDPQAVTARIHRAEMLLAAGNPAQALQDINDALKHEPRSLRLLYRRGLVLTELRRIKEACNDFRQVVQLSPESELRKKAEQRLRELGEA
jgi:tetratricopeptide (TPR) repeat protein